MGTIHTKGALCPLRDVADAAEGMPPGGESSQCIREKCAWWTSVYTTENMNVEGCAIPVLANMNSDGRFVV